MLQKTDFVFYQILYTIWKLSAYYADLMGYDAPENPLDMQTELVHIGKWSIIHIELAAGMEEGAYNTDKIKEILREYITIVLLPESEIPPYSNGDEIIESLHLHSVRHDAEKGNLNLDFLYLNNEEAFNLYKEDMRHG
ncbi:MAG: hypothetical protein NC543_09495 [bacterium]|nr:hypothetical protein [bacterium]